MTGKLRGEISSELTVREKEVARLVAQGLRNKDIAECVGLSVETVKVYMGRIFMKTGFHSRTQLAVHPEEWA